ncbi:MAG: hypothetical protein HKL80_08525, partial [Acidimicrobiales bacterium]|nr:hypothetical protein [Acidimicrobiales bacterium]
CLSLLVGSVCSACSTSSNKSAATSNSGTSTYASVTHSQYFLVSDSSGKKPSKGDSVSLNFAPQGKAWLLATSSTGDLSYGGSWSVNGSNMSLSFSASEFNHKVTFAFQPGQSTVKMPFQVFSTSQGSSTWSLNNIDPVQGAFAFAESYAAQSTNGASMSSIDDATAQYLAALTGASVKVSPSLSIVSQDKMAPGFSTASDVRVFEAPTFHPVSSNPDLITAIEEVAGGLILQLEGGDTVDVELFGSTMSGSAPRQIKLGPFISDPRTAIPPNRPGNGIDDPPNKTAVLFEPFENEQFMSWSATGTSLIPAPESFGNAKLVADEEKRLIDDKYSVKDLSDAKGTVPKLTDDLISGAPGLLIVDTHGMSNGDVASGERLGTKLSTSVTALDILRKKWTQRYGFPANAFEVAAVPSVVPGTLTGVVSLTPNYWKFLKSSKGVDFSKSMVFMNACLTDQTLALVDAIGAKAYFAWYEETATDVSNAVEDYIVRQLVKPTFTSEEVYYNLLRIDLTGLAAYPEDSLFQNVMPSQLQYNKHGQTGAIAGVLDAWGKSSSGQEIPYIGHGWLSPNISHQQVWFLLFAARWGSNTTNGITNLDSCMAQYWSSGTSLGGLASPFCQNANDGSAPTKQELGYATYLLDGDNSGFGGTMVPRFTLNDG